MGEVEIGDGIGSPAVLTCCETDQGDGRNKNEERPPPQSPREQQEHRKEQVELLFDRKAPSVQERQGIGRRREVSALCPEKDVLRIMKKCCSFSVICRVQRIPSFRS